MTWQLITFCIYTILHDKFVNTTLTKRHFRITLLNEILILLSNIILCILHTWTNRKPSENIVNGSYYLY